MPPSLALRRPAPGTAPAVLPCHPRRDPVDWVAAGYCIAGYLGELRPRGVDAERWADQLNILQELLDHGDGRAALRWLERELPQTARVPRHRRGELLRGIAQAAREIRVDGS